MIRLFYAVFLMLSVAVPLQAKTVILQSGDHDGFSRIVLEIGTPTPWRLGRTSDGYELQIQRNDLSFDVSRVFDLIPKTRVAAVWQDPETGALRFSVACACHAIPFEFRPGVIVIDLKNGPPPENSQFEASLAGIMVPDLVEKAAPRPHARPAGALPWLQGKTTPVASQPLPVASADLSPMRDALLRHLSDGAARGVVDMTVPPKAAPQPAKEIPLRQIRIGEDIGFVAGPREAVDTTLVKSGEDCIADDRLAIQDWGSDAAPITHLADARTGLIGEFDAPNPAAVERAVRYFLYLGFGTEARELINALAAPTSDRDVWLSMSKVLDGEPAAASAFSGMDRCDSAAAFWAVMSRAPNDAAVQPNTKAILRSFSGLPIHLRRHLGPALADRLLAGGDLAAAEAVRAAIMRAPGDSGPQVSLMDAAVDVATGDVIRAEETLTRLTADTTTVEAEALIALVDTLVQQGKPTDPTVFVALEALAFEHSGDPLEPELRRAYVIALASNAEFDAAFAALPEGPGAKEALWEMLARKGSDSAILTHATLASSGPLPDVPLATRRVMAERMLGLGFADPAAIWLGDIFKSPEVASEPDRILAAKIAITQKDARLTLRLIAGLASQQAASLRARAQAQLGEMSAAAATFLALGDAEAQHRALRLAQDWQNLPTATDDPWRAAADLIPPLDARLPASPRPISLSGARGLLAESESASTSIKHLLSQVQGAPASP